MLKNIKNYYLKKKVKQEVELFYIQMGINPKDLENMTMQEILERVNYVMENMSEYRERYFDSLDKIAELNGEINNINKMFKECERKLAALEIDNTKLKIKNEFLQDKNNSISKANVRNNVVSYERG